MAGADTLRDLELEDGDTVVVVPPKVSIPARRATAAYGWIAWALKGVCHCFLLLLRFIWVLPRAILTCLLDAWYDPWSLVRPASSEVPGRRIRTLGFTPQMVRYAPGQNPRGEDLTVLLSQGLLGM
eukprot:symbB.v1.2.006224.t1/scaffold340.1/size245066/10